MVFISQAQDAKAASIELASLTRQRKDAALHAMADALLADLDAVLAANELDVSKAYEVDAPEAMIDRLRLTTDRVAGMAQGLRDLAALPDPIGDVVRGWRLPSGAAVSQVRVPFGVVGIIYEARPNVTADAAGICLKSGNAVLLRGSRSAVESNTAIVGCLRRGLVAAGLNPDAVSLVLGSHQFRCHLSPAQDEG